MIPGVDYPRPSRWLPEDDVIRLTGTKLPKVQQRRLRRMGIAFIVSAVGNTLIDPSGIGERDDRATPNFKDITKPVKGSAKVFG